MFALIAAALLSGISAQTPHDAFVSVNGVRLHYVDWGGSGQTILFLIGGGNGSAHTFDSFAPLDSAVDYKRLAEISAEARFAGSPDGPLAAIERSAAASHPQLAKVKAPALAFVVVYDEMPVTQPQDDPAYGDG